MKFTPCATAWLDGRHVPLARARVPVTTHALQYGTSVFEGIRAYWNGKNLNVVRLA
ncbi:MAG: branched chain amino acid aminotransferase, partial [Thaumarchaeota archaeon]|nr:branched chain amino acid aminotransferase [Nitrososphaerota archaeon]